MAGDGKIRLWCKGSRNLGENSVRRRRRCRFGGQIITCSTTHKDGQAFDRYLGSAVDGQAREAKYAG
jgi:hypothetical protein